MATKKVTSPAKTTTKKAAAPKAKAAVKPAETKAKATAKPAAAKAAKPNTAITHAEISKKAEEIYKARVKAGKPGTQESDWLEAEKALKAAKKK